MATTQYAISGPTIYGYFENDKLNKKIILMGDLHYGKEGSCIIGGISIVDYIDQVAKENPNEKYNLFVEARIPPKLQLQEGRIKEKVKIQVVKRKLYTGFSELFV